MGKVVGAVIGAITIAVGVVTGNVWLIAQGASMVAGALLTPKIRQNRQASAVTLQLGEVPRETLFGQVLTGGSLVDAFNYGGKYGTDWECVIIALADHECDSLVGFYVNDKFVNYTGDGVVSGYNNQLKIYWQKGTEGQTVPTEVLTNGPGWTANDNGAGVAWVAVCYKADKGDAKNPIWPAGRPRFSFLVKGKKCYQARKDSTVPGGSGAHRWADPATWEWTDNPIDCRYNWVRGVYACNRVTDPSMLLVGRGLSAAEAPPENVAAPANVCDELVSLDAGGSEKRYRANGLVQADDSYISVEELFASACGGVIIQPEGSVEIEPGQAKSATFFFSDEDLLVGSSVRFSEFLSEGDDDWVNTIIPRYVEPTQKYADHAAPIRRVIQDVIDDGGSREQTLQLPMVSSGTQAGRVGEIARRMGRLWKRGQLTLGPRFAEVEEGDWGVWTSQRYLGGASVTFRVEAYSLDEKWHNTLNLREISSTVFAKDADKASTAVADLQGDPPPIGQPGAGAFSVAATLIQEGSAKVPALLVTGAADDDYPNLILFEYWQSDGVTDPETVVNWSNAGYSGRDVTRREISSVAPGATYYVAVSYVVGGEPGLRRILGPVTLGYPVVVDETGTPLVTLIDAAETLASGKSTIWYQPAPPSADESVGNDRWVDTDDGNYEYRRVAGTGRLAIGGNRILMGGNAILLPWTMAPDQRIAQALTDAAGAQATADGKVVTFNQEATPTAEGVGDLWYKPSTKIVYRWSGSAWEDHSSLGAPSGTQVGSQSADNVAQATTNFNTRNDRNGAAISAPTVPTDGTAVDHTLNTDGSADISFEWSWGGTEADIDGWLVYMRSSTGSSAYTFGTTPAEEIVYTLPADKRALILTGVAANLHYTFGVRAYRTVDPDVAASGSILSTLVKATGSGENPYQPTTNPAFAGNVTGTVNGVAAATVQGGASAANNGLNSDGTVKDGKVGTSAVVAGSLTGTTIVTGSGSSTSFSAIHELSAVTVGSLPSGLTGIKLTGYGQLKYLSGDTAGYPTLRIYRITAANAATYFASGSGSARNPATYGTVVGKNMTLPNWTNTDMGGMLQHSVTSPAAGDVYVIAADVVAHPPGGAGPWSYNWSGEMVIDYYKR